MHNTATVPNHITLKPSTLSVLLAAAVIATATITWGLTAAVDSESSSPAPATPTNSEILDGLSPSAREYVEGIMDMTPEQLAAAYGYFPVPAPATPTNSEILDGLSPSAREYVDEAGQVGLSQAYTAGLAALPPGELGWAYRSTPRWAIGLTAAQRAYVEGIRRMTPEELHAAFSRRLEKSPVDSSVSVADSAARAAYVQGIVAMSPEARRAAFGWHSDGSD